MMLAYEQQIAEHNVQNQKILISAITFIIALPVRLKVSFRGGKNGKKSGAIIKKLPSHQ